MSPIDYIIFEGLRKRKKTCKGRLKKKGAAALNWP